MHLVAVCFVLALSGSLTGACSPGFAVSPSSGWTFTHDAAYTINVTFPAGTKIILPGSSTQVPIENATSTQLALFFNTSQLAVSYTHLTLPTIYSV